MVRHRIAVNSASVFLVPQLEGAGSISDCRLACPPNGLRLVSDPSLAVELVRVMRVTIVVLALATIVLIVWRLVTGTPPRRRALAIGAPVALAFLVSQAVYQSTKLLEVQAGEFYPVAQWTIVATRSSIWYGFLLALIAAELFAGRMLRRVVTESLRRPAPSELEAMLREPLGDPTMRLAFRRRSTDQWVDARGAPLESPEPASGRVLTVVQRDGWVAAAIVHDGQLAEEPELLRAAGAIVLLVQENAALEAGWKRSLHELQDSRRRIVAASEAERRKLERDLHDGAQQRLVSLRIRLALASEQSAGDPVAQSRLGELEGDLDEAIEELRDLAHGIFPSLLNCCLEALQNATKHAGPAAHIAARLTAKNGELRLEVSDDGPGFDVAAVNAGDGLHNMEDRLGAIHGRLVIVSSPGNGTLITGVVPISASVP